MRKKADKGREGQFCLIFCGRPLWMTPYNTLTLPCERVINAEFGILDITIPMLYIKAINKCFW